MSSDSPASVHQSPAGEAGQASKDFSDRVKQLEDTVSRLELQQDSLRPLFRLTSGGLNLDGIRATLEDFQKKAGKTQDKLAQQQQRLDSARAQLRSQSSAASTELESEVQRRQAEAKKLEDRLGELEQTLKQAATINELAVKEIQAKLKEEVTAIAQNVERRLQEERGTLDGTIRDLKQRNEASLTGVKVIASDLETQLEDFEDKHAGLLVPGAEGDKGSLRAWLLGELKGSIRATVDECRSEFDTQLKALKLKFIQELFSIKNQLEQMRGRLNRNSKKEGTLAQLNAEARRLLSHLTHYGEGNLLNLEQLYIDLRKTRVSSQDDYDDLKSQVYSYNQERDQLNQVISADFLALQELAAKVEQVQPVPQTAPIDIRNAATENQEAWRQHQKDIAKLKERLEALQARIAALATSLLA